MTDAGYALEGQLDAGAHYFRLSLGGYDALNVSLERVGTNLTFPTPQGGRNTNGHGLRGLLLRQRASAGCPTALSYEMRANLTAHSTTESLVDFCTLPAGAADYIVGVLADMNFGPFPDIFSAASNGKIGPFGVPVDGEDARAPLKEQTVRAPSVRTSTPSRPHTPAPHRHRHRHRHRAISAAWRRPIRVAAPHRPHRPPPSPRAPSPRPRPCAPPRPRRVRCAQGYGEYTLRVIHTAFFGGEVSSGEERPACVAYGQWRTYYVDSAGVGDATLEVRLDAHISSTVMRADAPAALAAYDVRSPPRATLVTASPCDVTRPTRWHFAIYLAPEDEADDDGVAPTLVTLSIRLRDASLGLGDSVVPASDGGRGYACCGAVRVFRVPDIPEAHALQASINVTAGRLLGVYLKWGSCPSLADVDTLRGECTGFCTIGWLTTRGSYSGTLYSTSSATLTVPHGHGDALDKRRAGSWYVGVQAMEGEAAHYTLSTALSVVEYIPPSARCSRLTFACARDSARGAWDQAGPPAPPPSRAAIAYLAATRPGANTISSERLNSLVAEQLSIRVVPIAVLLVLLVCACWCWRSARARRRILYRVPHDSFI